MNGQQGRAGSMSSVWTIGQEIAARDIAISRADVRTYAAVSGDNNPIHLDDEAAWALGLPGVVAHGMLTMALAVEVAAAAAGGNAHVLSANVRFTAPVHVPVDTSAHVLVTVKVKTIDPDSAVLALTALCGGVRIFGRATVTVAIAEGSLSRQS